MRERWFRIVQWSREPGPLARCLPYVVGVLNLALFNVLFWIERGTFFGGDSGEFMSLADKLRSGALLANPNNGKPLGYPLLLALSASLPGPPVAKALGFNWLFFGVAILIVGLIARRLNCSPRVALFAQILFALVPNTAAWANLVLSDTLAMVLFVSSFWIFLKVIGLSEPAMPTRYLLGLGTLLGLLSLTRTEYVLLFPLVTVLFCGLGLSRRRSASEVLRGVLVVWVGGLLLMVQPMISGWRGLSSFVPPNQSRFLAVWGSGYDLEFTQLRFHRLADLIALAAESQQIDSAVIRAKLQTLKVTEAHHEPIDEDVLDLAFHDVLRLQDLVRTQGFSPLEGHRQLALELFARDPWRVVSRAVRRLWLFLTAEHLDWPRFHPAYLVYTSVLRPLSTLAYLALAILLLVNRVSPRGTLFLVGLWMAFPSLVHAGLIFEQRFMYPSIPFLCVVWAQALQAWGMWKGGKVSADVLGSRKPRVAYREVTSRANGHS